MNLPFISAICCTYARPDRLAEALACFHAQKYDGKKELVILNTMPEQTLCYEHPEVRIINLEKRPKTLGECRNIAITHATGELLVTWDDDDLYLSNHLTNFGKNYRPELGWIKQDRQFHSEQFEIKNVVYGSPNTVAFSKVAWMAVGGYAQENTGEDKNFLTKVSTTFPGVVIRLSNSELSFIYGWGQPNLYHVSGQGEDKNGALTAMERVELDAQRKIKARLLPTGIITLVPKLTKDWESKARKFVRGMADIQQGKVGKVGIVMLGRYGDILNCLPIAKAVADRYGKPHFFVAREFASVLDGVSYVIPEVLDIPYDHLKDALKVAHSKCAYVMNAQVYGQGFNLPRS